MHEFLARLSKIKTLLTCLALLSLPTQATAMCIIPTRQEALRDSLAAFAGTVVSISSENNTATLQVERYFKGTGKSTVTLATATSTEFRIEDESIALEVGKKYLIFVSNTRAADGLWMAGECSGSRPIAGFGEKLEELR